MNNNNNHNNINNNNNLSISERYFLKNKQNIIEYNKENIQPNTNIHTYSQQFTSSGKLPRLNSGTNFSDYRTEPIR